MLFSSPPQLTLTKPRGQVVLSMLSNSPCQDLEVLKRSGSAVEQVYASRILPVISNAHFLLVRSCCPS